MEIMGNAASPSSVLPTQVALGKHKARLDDDQNANRSVRRAFMASHTLINCQSIGVISLYLAYLQTCSHFLFFNMLYISLVQFACLSLHIIL
jgi:hypothetical protein